MGHAIQVVANFSFGDSMASFCADVAEMTSMAAARMEKDIQSMKLPNRGRVSNLTL